MSFSRFMARCRWKGRSCSCPPSVVCDCVCGCPGRCRAALGPPAGAIVEVPLAAAADAAAADAEAAPLPLSQCLLSLPCILGRRLKPRMGINEVERVENFRYVWLTLQ